MTEAKRKPPPQAGRDPSREAERIRLLAVRDTLRTLATHGPLELDRDDAPQLAAELHVPESLLYAWMWDDIHERDVSDLNGFLDRYGRDLLPVRERAAREEWM